jgi:hypothetical protein
VSREAAIETLAMARLALEARLKLADLLREEGKRADALAAYKDALARFEAELPVANEVVVEEIGLGGGVGAPPRGRPGVRRAAESAVELGLQWLSVHQDDDGRWDCDEFMKHDPEADRCDGKGAPAYDVGVTGLAVLAFLGAGYTDRGSVQENKYAKNVRQGLRFLMTQQDAEGCFGPRVKHEFMYNHAIATLAMCEAYWMTRNPRYRKPAQDGIAFLLKAQNPGAGWRYEPRGRESDTSVTAWCVAALKSARYAGFQEEVPDKAFADALAWVEKMTDPVSGRVGYNFPGGPACRTEAMARRFPVEKTESLTAAGIFTRMLCGQHPRGTEAIAKGARLCVLKPPVWDPDGGTIDMYYWYWGTLALFQVGGEEWRTWNGKMREAILKTQHPKGSGSRTGSWDPIDPWGLESGGRVYATALMTMSLEVYYRYDRAFGARAAELPLEKPGESR